MSNIEDSVVVSAVREVINTNNPEAALNSVFEAFGLSENVEKKLRILETAMGNPTVSYCGDPSVDERYKAVCHMFLSKVWM